MKRDKALLLLLCIFVTLGVMNALGNYFNFGSVTNNSLLEGFRSKLGGPVYSADFGVDLGPGACRCKNGAIGDIAHYINGGTCVCNVDGTNAVDRDRPELKPGELGQMFREKNAYYDLNCQLNSEYDAHIDITQPYKKNSGESYPMNFETYKKTAYIPCESTLDDRTSYEQQYKQSIMSQTKALQNRPYLYTQFQDDVYFKDWAMS
jgi:hypothetical protein